MVLPRPFLSLWPNKINYVKMYKRTNSYIILKKKLSNIAGKVFQYKRIIRWSSIYKIRQKRYLEYCKKYDSTEVF